MCCSSSCVADDIAVALRNVFHDLRVLRHFMAAVRAGMGLGLNADKSALINFFRRPHLAARDLAPTVLGFQCRVSADNSDVCSCPARSQLVGLLCVKFLARAAHVQPLEHHSLGVPLAYNTLAMSVVTYTAQLAPLEYAGG